MVVTIVAFAKSVRIDVSCESGGIGRRTRLRIWRGNPWGFESPLSHQPTLVTNSLRSGSRLRAAAHSRCSHPRKAPLRCPMIVPLRSREAASVLVGIGRFRCLHLQTLLIHVL